MNATYISSTELVSTLRENTESALIDVREVASFASGHILFATNISLSQLLERISFLVPRKQTTLVVCDSGESNDDFAMRAAFLLQKQDYSDIRILADGVKSWQETGYPLFTGSNVPSKAFGEILEFNKRPPSVQALELKEMLDRKEDILLLDCRTPEEYEQSTIPGSISAPGVEIFHQASKLIKSKKTEVIVHCGGRTRGIIGAQSLIETQLANPIFWLEDGLIGWELSDFPIVNKKINSQQVENVEPRSPQASKMLIHDLDNIGVLTKDSLQKKMDNTQHKTCYLFDIRSEQEYMSGHYPGSHHIPGGQLILKSDDFIAVRQAIIILVDLEGTRAKLTASWLKRMGYTNCFVYCPDKEELITSDKKEAPPTPTGLTLISAADLQNRMNENKNLLLLDISQSNHYCEMHIPGAIWITPSRIKNFLHDKKHEPFIITSIDGKYPIKSCITELQACNYDQIYALEGGTKSWAKNQLPVESSSGIQGSFSPVDDYFPPPNIPLPNSRQRMKDYIAWEHELPALVNQDPLWHAFIPEP